MPLTRRQRTATFVRHNGIKAPSMTVDWRRWTRAALALVLLSASLTFGNVWPTPAIRWEWQLSVEWAALVSLLAMLGPRARRGSWWLRAFSVAWVGLVIGHYADVTAPALYGREVNLYWDLQHVAGVTAMLATAAPVWGIVLVVLAVGTVLTLFYAGTRWALGCVSDAADDRRGRLVLGAIASVTGVLFIVQPVQKSIDGYDTTQPLFASPVSSTFLHQARLVVEARTAGSRSLAPSPPMDSDLSRVKDTDILLFFIESYGAVTYDRAEFAAALAASRRDLESAAREGGREVVSAFAESPTFGGNSWLAHISFLTGIQVRDPDTNARLMAQRRETLVTAFSRRGYRTVAVMPGLWQDWPEGAFYGFDDIYGGRRLDYRGPEFGWWAIPDQFALAKLDATELARRDRRPVFAFFPFITSHAPFSPIAPYQPDWPRLLGDNPYDQPALDKAFAEEPDWTNLGPSYVRSLAYDFASIAGYLRSRADRPFVMIVLGDHQPLAAVSGEGARWDVPVHVFTSEPAIAERLRAQGFTSGIDPAGPRVGQMNTLLTTFLDAMGDRPASTSDDHH